MKTLNKSKAGDGYHQVPRSHPYLPSGATLHRIRKPVRHPPLRIPYEATESRKPVERPQNIVDNRRAGKEGHTVEYSERSQIEDQLNGLRLISQGRLVEQGVDGAGEISVGRSSQKRIDVVHTEDKLGSSIYNLWRDG